MKTSLKLILLALLATFPALAIAALFGSSLPDALSDSTALGYATAALVAALVLSEYTPRRPLRLPRRNSAAPRAGRSFPVPRHAIDPLMPVADAFDRSRAATTLRARRAALRG